MLDLSSIALTVGTSNKYKHTWGHFSRFEGAYGALRAFWPRCSLIKSLSFFCNLPPPPPPPPVGMVDSPVSLTVKLGSRRRTLL